MEAYMMNVAHIDEHESKGVPAPGLCCYFDDEVVA
jgi:hypothetical protein